MALYHFSAKIVCRSRGQSAVAAAAYRARTRLLDERLGKTFDYSRRRGLVRCEIIAPDDAPDWMRDREELWNAVEKVERRKDSQLARSLDIALPHELSLDHNIELLRGFVQEQFVDKGMIADIAVHAPGGEGDTRNIHAHILLTTREIVGSGFGLKARQWDRKEELEEWRAAWADHANRVLEREGFAERVDHRSLLGQGIDREPTTHIGPAGKQMEQRGKPSDRARQYRNAEAANDDRALLQKELRASEKRLAELRRQLAAERIEQIQKTVRAVKGWQEKPEERQAPAPEPPTDADRPEAATGPAQQPLPPTAQPPRAPRLRPSAAERMAQAQKIIPALGAFWEKGKKPDPPAPDTPPQPPKPEPPLPPAPPSGPAPRQRPPSTYADLDLKIAERAKELEAEEKQKKDGDPERERKRRRER